MIMVVMRVYIELRNIDVIHRETQIKEKGKATKIVRVSDE